jgi:hypothetical protein
MSPSAREQPEINPHVGDEDEAGWEWQKAGISYPGWITLKVDLDRDVIDWFEQHSKTYSTLVKQVLQAYFEGNDRITAASQPAQETRRVGSQQIRS